MTYQLKCTLFCSTHEPCCPVTGRVWSRTIVPRGTVPGTSILIGSHFARRRRARRTRAAPPGLRGQRGLAPPATRLSAAVPMPKPRAARPAACRTRPTVGEGDYLASSRVRCAARAPPPHSATSRSHLAIACQSGAGLRSRHGRRALTSPDGLAAPLARPRHAAAASGADFQFELLAWGRGVVGFRGLAALACGRKEGHTK